MRRFGEPRNGGLFLDDVLLDRSDVPDYQDRIMIEPGKRGGKPCIRGLRVTVYDVLENLASGMSHEDILREFPYLTDEDIRACLAYAADRERKLKLQKAGSCCLTRICRRVWPDCFRGNS